MERKIVWMLVAILTSGNMLAQQVKYAISGSFSENGKMVYLIDKLTEKAIDSVAVADGKFTFSGTADKDALMGVMVGKKSWEIQFFNDGTPVVVNINDSTLTGSPQNERLAKYDVEGYIPMRNLHAKTARMTREEMLAKEDELMDEMNKAIDSEIALANRLFKEERNTLIPVAFAQLYFMDNGLEAYDELVKAQVVFANHPYLKKAKEDIEEMVKPRDNPKTAFIGQQFTDLEMADPDGKMHKMSELVGEGKYVLVDFWASWCGPCRAEMPNVLEAYNKYHDKGFEVIGISFDNKKDAWVKAVGQLNLPWLQLSDLKGWQCAAAPIYKIDAIPDNILIDPQGKIIDRALRGKSLHNRLQQIFDKQ